MATCFIRWSLKSVEASVRIIVIFAVTVAMLTCAAIVVIFVYVGWPFSAHLVLKAPSAVLCRALRKCCHILEMLSKCLKCLKCCQNAESSSFRTSPSSCPLKVFGFQSVGSVPRVSGNTEMFLLLEFSSCESRDKSGSCRTFYKSWEKLCLCNFSLPGSCSIESSFKHQYFQYSSDMP